MIPWLDRRIAAPGPYLTLCLYEKEFLKVMKYLKIEQHGPWINRHAHAGEETPGREQEAYAVQCISQELMAEFARRMKKGKRT